MKCLLLFIFLFASEAESRADLKLVDKWPTDEKACSDTPLRLTFDKPPVAGNTGKIEVCRDTDGVVVETIEMSADKFVDRFGVTGGFQLRYEPVWIEGNTAQVRIRAHALNPGESYFVRVSAGVFKDINGNQFSGIAEGWHFKTRPALPRNPDRLTVAADGSGDYCTVQGAIDQVEPYRDHPVTIFIRKGRYPELIRVGRERRNIHLLGEDRKRTILACANNEKMNPGWNQRAVIGVEGDDFTLENLTVQNTTPYKGSQAEALYANAERCVLRNADFLSFQDTLCLNGRVSVADSYIEGDVDYVWGYGTACFERCELRSLHDGCILQSRNPASRAGYLFLNCKLTAAPGVKKCWLARIEPARFPASHVAFIGCQMDQHIVPAGWQLIGPTNTSTALRFEEFKNTDLEGKPLDVSRRAAMAKNLTSHQAAQQTASQILDGHDHWNPTAESPSVVPR